MSFGSALNGMKRDIRQQVCFMAVRSGFCESEFASVDPASMGSAVPAAGRAILAIILKYTLED